METHNERSSRELIRAMREGPLNCRWTSILYEVISFQQAAMTTVTLMQTLIHNWLMKQFPVHLRTTLVSPPIKFKYILIRLIPFHKL